MNPDEQPAVLVVDDNDDARDACRMILETEGYRTVSASSGEAALRDHAERPDALCLIVLDLMMPRMTGQDFLARKATLATLAGVPVIVLSAAHDASRLLSADDVKAVLGKPVRLPELLAEVARWAGAPGPVR